MSTDWSEATLDRLYDFSSGLSKPRSDFGSGYPFLSFKDVFYNFFVPADLPELVNSTPGEREALSIRRGDVFLTRTSETVDELAMSCVALRDVPGATFNGFTKRLRPREGVGVLPEYIGYYFRSPEFRQQVYALSSPSTRASLNNEMLGRLTVRFPNKAEQERIASSLKSLDDKIELNRRMSETLEAMARELFKSWFVDFDPVRAKVEGRDTGLPQQLADLFPDSFEDSDLGEIPKGWSVSGLGDFLRLRLERCPASQETASRPYVPIECISSRSLLLSSSRPGKDAQSSLVRFYQGDLLFGAMRPYFHKVCIAPFDGTTRTTAFVLYPPKKEDFAFAALLLHHPDTVDYAAQHSSGSTIPYATWSGSTEMMPVIEPPRLLRTAFNVLAEPILRKIQKAFFANETLLGLRDLLLPKLIAGEMRVNSKAWTERGPG